MRSSHHATSPEPQHEAPPLQVNGHALRQCSECRAPMLLMFATSMANWPALVRKTYQCIVCQNIESQTTSIHD